jgi:hypothetical protein
MEKITSKCIHLTLLGCVANNNIPTEDDFPLKEIMSHRMFYNFPTRNTAGTT